MAGIQRKRNVLRKDEEKIDQTTKEIIIIRAVSAMLAKGYPVTREDVDEIEKNMDTPEQFKKVVEKITQKYEEVK